MDRAKFFAALRSRGSKVFGTRLTTGQVQGVEAILDECQRRGADLGQTAYILATCHGETGGKMQPRRENMSYSAKRIPQVFSKSRRQGVPIASLARNPQGLANTVYGGAWGKKNLGNTHQDDGWRFRGAGLGQITGRYNFGKWGSKMGVNLLTNPELLEDLQVSVQALVQPMLEGWATKYKLSDFVSGSKRDYRNARRVWNGTFAAAKYAQTAKYFEAALNAGKWTDDEFVRPDAPTFEEEPPVPPTPDAPQAPPKPAKPPSGGKGTLVGAIAAGAALMAAGAATKGCEWFGIWCQ